MGPALAPLIVLLALTGPADPRPPFGPEMIPLEQDLTACGFEVIGREQGVTVYQREDAELIQIAAEGRFAAPPEDVRRALLDYAKHAGRVERVGESEILERGESRLLVYQRLTLPLIDDRDFNLEVHWGPRSGGFWIHYRTSPIGRSARPGIVRVHHHRGSWQLKPLWGGSATWARYQSSIDLGGLLPTWMARSGAGDSVPGLFVALRRLLAEPGG